VLLTSSIRKLPTLEGMIFYLHVNTVSLDSMGENSSNIRFCKVKSKLTHLIIPSHAQSHSVLLHRLKQKYRMMLSFQQLY